jgi:hypothetical protein
MPPLEEEDQVSLSLCRLLLSLCPETRRSDRSLLFQEHYLAYLSRILNLPRSDHWYCRTDHRLLFTTSRVVIGSLLLVIGRTSIKNMA